MKNKNNIILIRRLVQLISVFLFVYALWAAKEPLTGYVNPKVYFVLDPLLMIVTSIAGRVFLPGLIFAFFVIVLTFVFGRVFCGWFCPFGAVMDLWAYVLNKFKLIKNKEGNPPKTIYIKYILLFIIIMFSFFGIQIAWIFDPITIFARSFSLNMYPFINNLTENIFIYSLKALNFPLWLENLHCFFKNNILKVPNPVFSGWHIFLSVFVIILLLTFIKKRFWCRYLCPLGAMLALVAKYSILKRVVCECKEDYNTSCSLCKNICRMNAINCDNSYLPSECILCMDCKARCPGDCAGFSFKKEAKEHNCGGNNEK